MREVAPPGALTILVVDDEEGIRRNVRAYLEDLGHQVFTAAEGNLALDLFGRVRPDVVLTDLRMPGMDGLALVEVLRRDAPDTPVIVFSGTGDVHEAVGAIRAGAWDFVVKPLETRTDLGRTVARCVDRAQRAVAERQQQAALESQLLRVQRQESLGRLASGIAHDLNNVLAPVMMAGDLLQTAPLDENGRECVEMIRTSAARGADMVKQLLLYSRGADGRRTSVEPSRVVRDVVRMVKETFPKDIDVKLALSDVPWLIEADRTQVYQVVLNLCVNARDAMPHGGVLSLSTEFIDVNGARATRHPLAKPGKYVVLMVSDTGTGIAPAVLDSIFDPFFTTKPAGQGTGLGLSTVQGIVASHGGFVTVESEPGKGASFRVYLPSAGEAGGDGDEDRAETAEVARGSGQTILVVDDEAMVRDIVQRLLEGAGYRVVVAESGEQALATYARLGPDVGLVLMDLWMPHMSGLVAIQHLARLDPQVRVIAVSGLAEARDEALRLHPVVRQFMVKPWRRDDLLRAVSDVLAAQQEGPTQ